MALKARATKPLQCLGCKRFYHAHELVLSIVANVCIRCFANERMGNRLLKVKSRLKQRSDTIMSPKKKETTKKTTKKRKTTKKLSKAEKLKAQAERLLIEASEAEDAEEEVEDESDDDDSGLYTQSELKKMKLGDVRTVAKDLGLTVKGVKKSDLISEILDVQSIEDDEDDEEEEEDEAVDVEFDNAGSFDRESGDFTPDKDYKRLFASIDFKTVKSSMFEALSEKEDFEWYILATDATKKKGEDGIFMRLSKSGESFIFYIHERLFCIPISHIQNDDGSFDSIGVSEVTFS